MHCVLRPDELVQRGLRICVIISIFPLTSRGHSNPSISHSFLDILYLLIDMAPRLHAYILIGICLCPSCFAYLSHLPIKQCRRLAVLVTPLYIFEISSNTVCGFMCPLLKNEMLKQDLESSCCQSGCICMSWWEQQGGHICHSADFCPLLQSEPDMIWGGRTWHNLL